MDLYGHLADMKEAETVNHRLGRLLRPGVGAYFTIMAIFCAATLLAGEYLLAAMEAFVVLAAFLVYVLHRNR